MKNTPSAYLLQSALMQKLKVTDATVYCCAKFKIDTINKLLSQEHIIETPSV